MEPTFFGLPVLNSPYEYPFRHWKLGGSGEPTNRILPERGKGAFITRSSKPGKHRGEQREIVFAKAAGAPETETQRYELTEFIGGGRQREGRGRELPRSNAWSVTPDAAGLRRHWLSHRLGDIRGFFCQVETVETAIWLTEVAPTLGKEGRRFLGQIDAVSEGAKPGLGRLASKLATSAGKTTVMAMIIAWQTIIAVRRQASRRFTRGFLVVNSGVAIRARRWVVQPNDQDSYYASREPVPKDMLRDLERAKIVISNKATTARRANGTGGRRGSGSPGAKRSSFLRGSGYAERSLLPCTASDFLRMDAIDCGIVSCRACRWPTTFPAPTSRRFATCGSTSGRRCRSGDAARRAGSTAQPAARSPDRSQGPLRPLREDVRALARGRIRVLRARQIGSLASPVGWPEIVREGLCREEEFLCRG